MDYLRCLFDESLPIAPVADKDAVVWLTSDLELPTTTETDNLHLYRRQSTRARAGLAIYGMIAYHTAFLKANYSVEYMTAVLSAEMGVPDRVAIAVAAVFMQFVLGGYYSWGALIGHLESAYHWSQTQVSSLFTVANLTFGLACLAGGLWMRKSGSRKVARVAGILLGGGIFLAAFSGSFGEACVIRMGVGDDNSE